MQAISANAKDGGHRQRSPHVQKQNTAAPIFNVDRRLHGSARNVNQIVT
jgi:hypothetical protein